MPALIPPEEGVQTSFLEAMAEFAAEGRTESMTDSWIGRWSSRWQDEAAFGEFVDELLADRLEESARSAHLVPCTTLWWVQQGTYLGRISIRHRLNEALLEYGGHIGYDVRPSARRQGHATAMLAAALPRAHALGIDPALITCDLDNVASIDVIEANGGVWEDVRGPKRRYWVGTG